MVEVNPKKQQDNSAPMFVAFQRKMVDISASPIVMKAERLRKGDIIGPVWPMRCVISQCTIIIYKLFHLFILIFFYTGRVFYFARYPRQT